MCHREASFPEMWSLPTAKPFDPSDYLKIFFDTGVLKGRAKGSGVVLFPFLVLCVLWALSVQELLFLVLDNILRFYDNFFSSRFSLLRPLVSCVLLFLNGSSQYSYFLFQFSICLPICFIF